MIRVGDFNCGLGNQLFKIAAAIGVAKKYNDEIYCPDFLYADYFEGDFINGFILPPDIENSYTEPEFRYHEIPYKPNMVLNGYFQSEKYFAHCKKFVKRTLRPKTIDTDIKIEHNSCFIHVRRGDYKNLQDHHPLKTWDNYYKRAVERIDSFYPSKYYIFSDELETVKQEFPENKMFEYIKGGDEMTDLYLMTKCQYHIIGNSTFSWWGAYLCERDNPQTIAPADWFGPAYYYHNTKDLLPESWFTV